MPRTIRIRRVAWLALSGLALLAAAGQVTHVHRPQHRTAEELLPLAQATLGEAGTAVVDSGTNALLLVGPPEAVGAAREVLRLQDRPRRTVVVHTESRRLAGLMSAGYAIRWGIARGGLRVGNVSSAGGDAGVALSARAWRSRSDASFAATLRILEGETARIASGRAVPVVSRGPYGHTTLVEAESGLLARPRILGDGRVQLQIRPFRGRVDPAARVDFGETDTTLVVEPGETLVVASVAREGESARARVFSSAQARQTRDDQVVLLRVEIEGPDAEADALPGDRASD